MFEIDSFLSIINPPQGSILSIGPAKKVLRPDDSGDVKVSDVISIGYAVDHRVIDGSVAAKFLVRLCSILEHPILIFV